MITRLDQYVGEIFAKLKEKGLDRNTVVIFTSDNGPHEEGGADPEFFGRDGKLKGLKRQCYEGGIRIPFIAWWPEHIKAGAVNDTQFAFTICCLLSAIWLASETLPSVIPTESWLVMVSTESLSLLPFWARMQSRNITITCTGNFTKPTRLA